MSSRKLNLLCQRPRIFCWDGGLGSRARKKAKQDRTSFAGQSAMGGWRNRKRSGNLAVMNTLFTPPKETEEAAPNPMFIAIFREHWENVRHIKNERLTFTNIYGIITAGTLSLMHSF